MNAKNRWLRKLNQEDTNEICKLGLLDSKLNIRTRSKNSFLEDKVSKLTAATK